EEDAGDDLVDQHQQGERAEVVPEVEVLGRVVLTGVRGQERQDRQTLFDPCEQAVLGLDAYRCRRHHAAPCGSTPIWISVSETKWYGGTCRLAGAGTPSNTRPAMS